MGEGEALMSERVIMCSNCDGEGELIILDTRDEPVGSKPCPDCNGRGVIDEFLLIASRMIRLERQRQIAKWGAQDGNTWPEWMAILMEEVGELAEAVNETWFRNAHYPERGGLPNILKEAMHTAAVAQSIMEACLRKMAEGEGVPRHE